MRVVIAILALWVIGMIGYLAYEELWTGGKGAIVVISEPPGADIYLDIRPTQLKTDGRIEKVHAGEHSISVKLEHYLPEPHARVVKVRSGGVDTVRFHLKALSSGATTEAHQRAAGSMIPERVSAESDTILARLLAERGRAATTLDSVAPPVLKSEYSAAAQVQDSVASAALREIVQDARDATPPAPQIDSEFVAKPVGATEGTIEISSSVAGATIFVDDHALNAVTPANITLPFGTYELRVELAGYSSDPSEQSLRVSRGNSRQFVFFALEKIEAREIYVTTSPIAGVIFSNGVEVGTGTVVIPHDFGVFNITFGDVEGWRTPEPTRLTVSAANPRPEVTGVYTKRSLIYVAAGADGALDNVGGFSIVTGVHFEEGGFQPSSAGPKVKQIPSTSLFGWEVAQGDGSKNPPGEDYVQFEFNVADDEALAAYGQLRLYAYRSPRRYPLSLSSKSELAVTVNGKSFVPAWSPRYNTDAAGAQKYEEWPLERMLQVGTNRIVIRATPENTVYHYVWKVELN